MSVAEMRVSRWISGNTWKYNIPNEEITNQLIKIGVVPVDEKMMVLVMCRGEQLVHC